MRERSQHFVTLVALVVSAALGGILASSMRPKAASIAVAQDRIPVDNFVDEEFELAALPINTFESLRRELPQRAQTADEYLCDVYNRTPTKKDAAGDFTWKDPAAARRQGMDVCSYVIGGMAPELRERLAAFGKVADSRGIEWSILSGFRDDYRQSIAEGLKAGNKTSKHGGSRATGGYGDGRAADIIAVPFQPLMALVDQIGKDMGLSRPYKSFDPYHVQLSDSPQLVAKTAKVRHAKRHRGKSSHRRA